MKYAQARTHFKAAQHKNGAVSAALDLARNYSLLGVLLLGALFLAINYQASLFAGEAPPWYGPTLGEQALLVHLLSAGPALLNLLVVDCLWFAYRGRKREAVWPRKALAVLIACAYVPCAIWWTYLVFQLWLPG